jgi:hypothetical protein
MASAPAAVAAACRSDKRLTPSRMSRSYCPGNLLRGGVSGRTSSQKSGNKNCFEIDCGFQRASAGNWTQDYPGLRVGNRFGSWLTEGQRFDQLEREELGQALMRMRSMIEKWWSSKRALAPALSSLASVTQLTSFVSNSIEQGHCTSQSYQLLQRFAVRNCSLWSLWSALNVTLL